MNRRVRTVETTCTEFCKCGTHDHLVVTGFSFIDLFVYGKYAWIAKCFKCEEKYLIDDQARDEIFGTGWRKTRMTRETDDGDLIVEKEKPQQCDLCGKIAELRPTDLTKSRSAMDVLHPAVTEKRRDKTPKRGA